MRAVRRPRRRLSDSRAAPCTGGWKNSELPRMAERRVPSRVPLAYEQRITALTIALAVPAMLLGAVLLYWLNVSPILRVCLFVVLVLIVGATAALLREVIVQPLRGLANVIEAYRAGDYTVRGRRAGGRDALGELAGEINDLGKTLHQQRLKAMEATALLEKLINSIDVAVFAFDSAHQLRLANPAAARLLDVPTDFAIGRGAIEIALEEFLEGSGGTRIVASVAGHAGRWQVTHGIFRESGLAQHLLIVADLRQALREEERLAWQRLIRVIGHEVNNSLTPIRSLAETLRDLVAEKLAPGRTRDDALDALGVIGDRTDSLGRFLAQYSRLARLPPPKPRWVALQELLSRVAALDTAHRVEVQVDRELEACVDEDQLEQALINLVKNATEAQGEAAQPINLVTRAGGHSLVVAVRSPRPGNANPEYRVGAN